MKFLVTADNNGAIGRGGQPLVTIPAVQQGFLKETQGKVVVMGRKTLEGLPGGQPLGCLSQHCRNHGIFKAVF